MSDYKQCPYRKEGLYAKDSTEAIKVANRTGDDWVILREIDSTYAQILHYEP